MSLSFGSVALASCAYLGALFVVAALPRRSARVAALARSPLVFALALGVYASAWTIFGAVGFAGRFGALYLAVYLGPTLACLLVPVLWAPLQALARRHRLASLADFFAFRFRSQAAGVAATLGLALASVPYLGQQIRAVTDAARVLTGGGRSAGLALAFCAVATFFAALFGAREDDERHEGLLLTIAVESLVKLVALGLVGLYGMRAAFGGVGGLDAWLHAHPAQLAELGAPVREGRGWPSLLLVSFAAAFLLPRQAHFALSPRADAPRLRAAGAGLPLYLLLLTLPTLPLLFAGRALGLDAPPDFFSLALPLALGQRGLALVAFIGGLSAASAMVVVTLLALSAMAVTHLVLPLRLGVLRGRPYAQLAWLRRGVMAALMLAGYGLYAASAEGSLLVLSGISSFVAVAQLLPGLLGALFWRRAAGPGFVAGLAAGLSVWALTSLAPLVAGGGRASLGAALGWREGDDWSLPTFASLTANALVFVLVSLARAPSAEEEEGAALCSRAGAPRAERLVDASARDFRARLGPVLGEGAAEIEVARALAEEGVGADEARGEKLWRVRDRVERNLSALMGPVLARAVVDERWRAEPSLDVALTLGETPAGGVAAPPSSQAAFVRRYFRAVLEALPLGACALGPEGGVVLWNRALARLSGLGPEAAVGCRVGELAEPWRSLFAPAPPAADEGDVEASEVRIDVGGAARALRLRRSSLPAELLAEVGVVGAGAVVLVEDRTEQLALEARVAHQDRLALVGRLAAGVAHEIGNPTTAIACLAENLAREGGEAAERAAMIVEQTRRIDAIVRSLLAYCRGSATPGGASPPPRVGALGVSALVDEAVALVRLGRAAHDVRLENVCDGALGLLGDRRRLLQVFVNLLTNACDATAPGGLVVVDAEAAGRDVLVRVTDAGAGLSAEAAARAFEPFFTTKGDEGGTGLGLALVGEIVREHGGEVALESEPGAGTTVTLRLPAAAAEAAP
ncbi:MAG: ATP-binding protein [Polyangiaceae bacterium]|nr:ATP-binding protein [Polyangiaceae bacterium]